MNAELLKTADVHKLYHKFIKHFQVETGKGFKWKYTGYELMKKVKRWAQNNPQVKVIYCDDDIYCSSYLVFIPHQNNDPQSVDHYHGTTVIFISQTNDFPTVFFLYPHHARNVVDTLKEIKAV